MVESRSERITDGKALMDLVTGATRWDFHRDAVDSEDASVHVDRLYGTILFSLKNWKRYFDEDRRRSEEGLTKELAEIGSNGYSLVAAVTPRKSSGPGAGGEQFHAVLRIVKA